MPAALAEVIRNEMVESVHYGHLVLLNAKGEIQLVMDQGYSSPTAKVVTAGARLYGLVEGELFFAYDMAAEGQTLQAHIWSTLPRVIE